MPNNMVMSGGLNAPPEEVLRRAGEIAAYHLGYGVADLSYRVDCTETCLLVYSMSVAASEVSFPPDKNRGELAPYEFFLPSTQHSEVVALFSLDGSCWVKEGREHCLAVLLPAVVLASLLYEADYDVTWQRHVPRAYLLNGLVENRSGDYVETVRYAVSAGSVTCVV